MRIVTVRLDDVNDCERQHALRRGAGHMDRMAVT